MLSVVSALEPGVLLDLTPLGAGEKKKFAL
jgi:hypothetical protein